MVGLVLVSHSRTLVEGLRDIVAQFGGDPAASDGAVLLLDFGSAALSVEMALEDLSDAERALVRVPEAPLVEGAFVAGVQASIGASLDEVAAAAESARTMTKLPKD